MCVCVLFCSLKVSDENENTPRGVSPTMQAIQEAEAQAAKNRNKSDDEKVGSNPFKQSRTFKMLEKGLNDSEVSEVTGEKMEPGWYFCVNKYLVNAISLDKLPYQLVTL